jgi:hypothetical protein
MGRRIGHAENRLDFTGSNPQPRLMAALQSIQN